MDVSELLDKQLQVAEGLLLQGSLSLDKNILPYVEEILSRSEASKAVLTVLLTSLVYKYIHPEQDIRRHQSGIEGGYSGRTFDTHHITPFLKRHRFPSMAESGWLTRSLEQKIPYDMNYPGAIRPENLKQSFLRVIEYIQSTEKLEHQNLLNYLLARLIEQREQKRLVLATPQNLSIKQLLTLLERHFSYKYKFDGVARLPSLALYAIYQVLVGEMKRFDGCSLLSLESHTSADRQSGRMGDLDVVDAQGTPFEAVEVKFEIPITLTHIETAYEKFMGTGIKRYYILSTQGVAKGEQIQIEECINDIKNSHGCQVIVNGIYTTLRYYLRLIEDPAVFIEKYTYLLEQDTAIKYEHKEVWNRLSRDILKK